MAAATRLVIRGGSLAVHKRFLPEAPPAGGAPDPGVRHLAVCRWLRAAADDPVPRLLGADRQHLELTMTFAGTETAVSGNRPPAELARLLAAVATTVGSMHRRGLVHGAIAGDHIVVDGPRFALCGPSGLVDDPGVDVAAFGPLIAQLPVEPAGGPWEAVLGAAADPSMSAARLGRRLAALADRLERRDRRGRGPGRWRQPAVSWVRPRSERRSTAASISTPRMQATARRSS